MGKREFRHEQGDDLRAAIEKEEQAALSCDYCGLEATVRDHREAKWWAMYRKNHYNKKYACPHCSKAIAHLRWAMLKVEVN